MMSEAKRLMTIDDVKGMQYFQMPRVFFNCPDYQKMKNESKIGYMLMLDLLPLSVKNKWTNKHNEVFVKLSRSKLMELLNIKGTQKAAQIMKELSEYGLIFYKRVGLAKCNEIYLYPPTGRPVISSAAPEEEVVLDHSVMYDHEDFAETAADQVPATDIVEDLEDSSGQDSARDIKEIEDLLVNQIHLEDLKQKYSPELVDEVALNIREMFFNTNTLIDKEDKPMFIMRIFLRKLKMYHIEYVIDQFNMISSEDKIYHSKRYLQTLIYNSVFEANAKMIANINYHMGS